MVLYGLIVLTGLLGFCTMLLVSSITLWVPEASFYYVPHLLFLPVSLVGMAQLRWMLNTTRKAVLDKQEEA